MTEDTKLEISVEFPIIELDPEKFDNVIDTCIERETQDTEEIPAPIFYKALWNIFRVEQEETEPTPQPWGRKS